MSKPDPKGLEAWLAAKGTRKKKVATFRDRGMSPMADETKAVKVEMKTGFHAEVRERDRVDQYLQALRGITRKIPAHGHADHVIEQHRASRLEKTDPRYGIGCTAQTNLDRYNGIYGAAMLKENGLLYQVIWIQEAPEQAKRRRMDEETATAWEAYDKPDWIKDGHFYLA